MTPSSKILFDLLRLSVGNDGENSSILTASKEDWLEVFALSYAHAVSFTAVDGLDKFFERDPDADLSINDPELRPDKYQWYGGILYAEEEYQNQYKVLGSLAKLYASQGIRMMVVKGYCNSLDWPVPAHRSMGDIDVYLFGNWEVGDELIARTGIPLDYSHHHHSVFKYKGIDVENHFDFINVHSHKSGKGIEASLKRMADESLRIGKTVKVGETDVYLPTDQFNAVFLMRHMAIHFAAEQMYLRQLLDWALFVRIHHEGVDWNAFWRDVEDMGMMQFVLCINSICVTQLGFDETIFHTPEGVKADERTTARVLDDILKPMVSFDGVKGLRFVFGRLFLWLGNGWKNRIVYSDSMISTFFYQIISHLKKPASIFH